MLLSNVPSSGLARVCRSTRLLAQHRQCYLPTPATALCDIRVVQELKLAEKGSVSTLPNWQLAWLKRHEPELIARMATIAMDIVDRLAEKQWIDPATDLYQRIEAQTTIANERARLLLNFVRSSTAECFWDLQVALGETGCVDLALSRHDERAVVETFTDEELTAAFYLLWQEGRPASVVKVNKTTQGALPWVEETCTGWRGGQHAGVPWMTFV